MTLDEQYTAIEEKIPKIYEAGKSDGKSEERKVVNDIISGKVTSLTIPTGCSKIRAYAFYYAKITSVAIESTRLDGIYAYSFANCSSLTELRISDKSNIRRFGAKAFYKCSNLKVIDLTNYSGSDIPRLDSIDAFDGVHADCVIIVPAKFYTQWISATNWSAVADMIVPDLKYGSTMFRFVAVGGDPDNLLVTHGFGVTEAGHQSVRDVNVLEKLDTNSVGGVGDGAFYNNDTIKRVTISSKNIVIGVEAFYMCISLESVTFKGGVRAISVNSFAECSNCLTYDFSSCTSIPTLTAVNAFSGINENAKMLIPKGLYDEWRSATNWAEYADYMVAV